MTRFQSAIREIFERFLGFLARFEGIHRGGGCREQEDLKPYLDYLGEAIIGVMMNAHLRVTKEVLPSIMEIHQLLRLR